MTKEILFVAIRAIKKDENLWNPVLVKTDKNGTEKYEDTFAKYLCLIEGLSLEDVLEYKL